MSSAQKTGGVRRKLLQLHKTLKEHLSRLASDVQGQGIAEYILMLALVAFAGVAAEPVFACRVACAFENVANKLEQLVGTGKKIPPGQVKKCSRKCA